MNYQLGIEFARRQDQDDPLASFRDRFHIPKQSNGKDEIYLCGNSLGLQPKKTAEYLAEELRKWQTLAVLPLMGTGTCLSVPLPWSVLLGGMLLSTSPPSRALLHGHPLLIVM